MERSYLLAANLPVISAALCVTFFCVWLGQKERRHVINWSLSYACGFIGSTIGLVRMFLEDAAGYSFLANALLVGMAYFAARGVIVRHECRTPDHLLLPIYAATILAGLWFGFVEPIIIARGTAASVGAAAMFVIAARATMKHKGIDTVDYLTAVAFIVTAAMLVGRPLFIYAFDTPVQVETDVTGSWWGISFRFLAMLMWVLLAILFLQRITTDLLKDLRTQSLTDPLTGIPNRRGFFSLAASLAKEETFAVVLCDIDEFKKVNDAYGHKAGDTVIQDFARVMEAAAAGCTIGRLGGEEFVGLLRGTDIVGARAFAENIRSTFAATPHRDIPRSHTVTVSIGVAVALSSEPLEAVLDHADAALYRAKSKGRDCVEIAVMPLSDNSRRISGMSRRRGSCA
ncbi:GGDEF domain-containing protein [Mesorhizobium sp. 1B3]|uniref:GGDEF domain-containing protein n=1 Tax=Mesorhizobium sp. 1B3 TaxID=3243599 RepID=UPI003D97E7DF